MPDLTLVAIPGYFATIAAEAKVLRARAVRNGPSAVDYEPKDTRASLSMGLLSIAAPIVMSKVLRPIASRKSRSRKAVIFGVVGAAVVATIADRRARNRAVDNSDAVTATQPDLTRQVASLAATAAIGGGVLLAATGVNSLARGEQVWHERRHLDLGEGVAAWTLALVGWDFIYYWNHRFMHQSRFMWAIHVVHHSSERYNLSTALRQPVADSLGAFVPYGALAYLGVSPRLIAHSRAINLIYQYWIHTDTIKSIGKAEAVLNTPAHHRVHHGVNQQYLDRNHGGILIAWDKLFGTFEPEREPVVYGLTKNIKSFGPARIIGHEYKDMINDVYRSDKWADRLSYVFRGPGWAYVKHAEQKSPAGTTDVKDVLV